MMRLAHARSSDGLAGRQTKILRRLGVSLAPDGSNGPLTVIRSTCGSPRWSVAISVLRRNGCSRVAPSDVGRCRKAAPTGRCPARTFTRTCSRSSSELTTLVALTDDSV
jgi:hypothetical protein